MTREERFKMDTIDEFKLMCKIVGSNGRIIANKHRMLKALEQQEPRKGHWIKMPIGFKCSNCNELEDRTTKYCPNCGAYMREDK
jgi:phage regulator Rha-like protein